MLHEDKLLTVERGGRPLQCSLCQAYAYLEESGRLAFNPAFDQVLNPPPERVDTLVGWAQSMGCDYKYGLRRYHNRAVIELPCGCLREIRAGNLKRLAEEGRTPNCLAHGNSLPVLSGKTDAERKHEIVAWLARGGFDLIGRIPGNKVKVKCRTCDTVSEAKIGSRLDGTPRCVRCRTNLATEWGEPDWQYIRSEPGKELPDGRRRGKRYFYLHRPCGKFRSFDGSHLGNAKPPKCECEEDKDAEPPMLYIRKLTRRGQVAFKLGRTADLDQRTKAHIRNGMPGDTEIEEIASFRCTSQATASRAEAWLKRRFFNDRASESLGRYLIGEDGWSEVFALDATGLRLMKMLAEKCASGEIGRDPIPEDVRQFQQATDAPGNED